MRKATYKIVYSSGEIDFLYDRPYLTKEEFRDVVRTLLFDMEMFPKWGNIYRAYIYKDEKMIYEIYGQLYKFTNPVVFEQTHSDGFTMLWIVDKQTHNVYDYKSPNVCTREYFLNRGMLDDVL